MKSSMQECIAAQLVLLNSIYHFAQTACCVLLLHMTVYTVVLSLGVHNLLLIGDHMQLQPFTVVHSNAGSQIAITRSRSLLERAVAVSSQLIVCLFVMYTYVTKVSGDRIGTWHACGVAAWSSSELTPVDYTYKHSLLQQATRRAQHCVMRNTKHVH
jgi:hypothetical protein